MDERRAILHEMAAMTGEPMIIDRVSLYQDDQPRVFEMTVRQLNEVGFEPAMRNLADFRMNQAFVQLEELNGKGLGDVGLGLMAGLWEEVFRKTTDNRSGHRFLTDERRQLLLDIATRLEGHEPSFVTYKSWHAERIQNAGREEGGPFRPARRVQVVTPTGGVAGGQSG